MMFIHVFKILGKLLVKLKFWVMAVSIIASAVILIAILIMLGIILEEEQDTCVTAALERESQVDRYTTTELGARTIDLLPTISSYGLYCLDGALSLDPLWFGNRVKPQELPQSPIDLQAALGVSPTTPDLKAVYCIADEIFLKEGSMVSYKVNDQHSVQFCLSNPGGIPDEESGECSSYINDNDGNSVLALEKDTYIDNEELPNPFEGIDQFSGTIIFADMITIIGEVQTGGYDLVLVTNHLQFCSAGSINTKPPNRPAGYDGYPYGYGEEGYRGGDVVIFAKNVKGSININTTGGLGQEGAESYLPDVDMSTFRVCRVENIDDIPLNPDICTRSPRELGWGEASEWDIIDALYEYKGEEGLGGKGGDAGNITIFTTDTTLLPTLTSLEGGSAGPNGLIIGPKPFDNRAINDYEWWRYWQEQELAHGHFYLFWYYCPSGIHRHCNAKSIEEDGDIIWEAIDCAQYPDPFYLLNQTQVEPGLSSELKLFIADVPFNLLPFEEATESFVTPPREENSLPPTSYVHISNVEFSKAQHSFAPRAVEVLTLKADNLFRALSDNELIENDIVYTNAYDYNPFGLNRIDKARYLYASAAFFAVDAIENNLSEDEASVNPFWYDCAYALAQKRKLEAGLNYFGFEPGFFLYAKPSGVYPYLDELRDHLDDLHLLVFAPQVEKLHNAMVNREDAGVELTQLQMEEEEAREYKNVVIAEFQAAQTRLLNSLERIDVNSSLIEENRNQIEPILSQIEQLTTPPPCDAWCWATKIFDIALSIGQIVSDICEFDFGALTEVCDKLTKISAVADTWDAIKGTIDYANLLINGKTGTVWIDTIVPGVEWGLNVENDAFKKDVIDRGKSVYDNANKLIDEYESIISMGENPLAGKVAKIRESSSNMASNLQENLVQIYTLQSNLEGNPEALALALSLEDITKYIQNLNRQIPEFQRQHVEAAADILIMESKVKLAENNIRRAEKAFDLYQDILDRYHNGIVHAESMVDMSCRSVRHANDVFLLMEYLYQRSIDYMTLEPSINKHFNRNILNPSDHAEFEIEDANIVLNRFVSNVLHQTPDQQPGVVVDYIMPVEYKMTVSIGTAGPSYQFTERTLPEIAQALCPDGSDPCTLTKAAYNQEAITALKNSGIMTFELKPWSLEAFQALTDEKKDQWNGGLTIADLNYQKKRVIDVAARILLEDYDLPTFDNSDTPGYTIIYRLKISHGARATFVLDESQTLEDFYFGDRPPIMACHTIASITGSDLNCESIRYFNKTISSPFTEITSTYTALNAITVEEFKSNAMYGTSLHGEWTIDITEMLDTIELYGTQATEDFWNAFRGIEFKVFWVSLP